MEQAIKALQYALSRDLRTDLFVFKRTIRMLKSQVVMFKSKSKSKSDVLDRLEQILEEKGIFNQETIDEYSTEIQFDLLFSESEADKFLSQSTWWSPEKSNYIQNLRAGMDLLQIIKDKKKEVLHRTSKDI